MNLQLVYNILFLSSAAFLSLILCFKTFVTIAQIRYNRIFLFMAALSAYSLIATLIISLFPRKPFNRTLALPLLFLALYLLFASLYRFFFWP